MFNRERQARADDASDQNDEGQVVEIGGVNPTNLCSLFGES
jgi:hypothetical protein